jgi:hypothetical protein
MSGLGRHAAVAEAHAKAMAAGFFALEAADKEVCRLLQECATRVFTRDEKDAQAYLDDHRTKRAGLRQAFAESARALEVVLEQAKAKPDRGFNKSEVEADIDRLVRYRLL